MMQSQTSEMANLEWHSELSVGVAQMDEQHIALFALYNDACAALEEVRVRDEIQSRLRTFFDRTHNHFISEEELLKSTGYPGLADHADHHRDLYILLTEYMQRFDRGDLGNSSNLLSFLRAWLIRHIQCEDKDYGSWLNSHGIH